MEDSKKLEELLDKVLDEVFMSTKTPITYLCMMIEQLFTNDDEMTLEDFFYGMEEEGIPSVCDKIYELSCLMLSLSVCSITEKCRKSDEDMEFFANKMAELSQKLLEEIEHNKMNNHDSN